MRLQVDKGILNFCQKETLKGSLFQLKFHSKSASFFVTFKHYKDFIFLSLTIERIFEQWDKANILCLSFSLFCRFSTEGFHRLISCMFMFDKHNLKFLFAIPPLIFLWRKNF